MILGRSYEESGVRVVVVQRQNVWWGGETQEADQNRSSRLSSWNTPRNFLEAIEEPSKVVAVQSTSCRAAAIVGSRRVYVAGKGRVLSSLL